MANIIGVIFKKPGKIYFFDPDGIEIEQGEHVIVETAMGKEYGEVAIANRTIPDDKLVKPLKKIIRVATNKDKKQHEENKEKEKEDLVKDLAAIFKTRIELRQIGVRDEVKNLGGNGMCGRELCCCSFLGNFETVSIKMAKEQNISLNPSKISGNCGRLMCCLKYEQEVYEEKLKRLPKVGAIVKTEDGEGEVCGVETLKEIVKVKLHDGEDTFFKKYNSKDIKIIKNAEKEDDSIETDNPEDLKELQELEKLEKMDEKNKK